MDGFVKQSIAAKPNLVQISSAYGAATEGSAALPRNKYVEIRTEKPTNEKQRDWPEYKTCKFTTEAIVTEGTEKGELRTICANPECTIHHARKQKPTTDTAFKEEQEKRRREEAIAQATGLRVLEATSDTVPVRLMKRDLLFVAERLAAGLDERRLAVIFRLHGIGKASGTEEGKSGIASIHEHWNVGSAEAGPCFLPTPVFPPCDVLPLRVSLVWPARRACA